MDRLAVFRCFGRHAPRGTGQEIGERHSTTGFHLYRLVPAEPALAVDPKLRDGQISPASLSPLGSPLLQLQEANVDGQAGLRVLDAFVWAKVEQGLHGQM